MPRSSPNIGVGSCGPDRSTILTRSTARPLPRRLETLRDGWRASNGDYKKGLLREKAKRYEEAVLLLTRAVERYPGHAMALERLGVLTYAGKGTTQSTVRSIELLGTAVRLEPTLFDANLFLGLALAREDREAEARRCFERAILLDSHPPLAMAMYADAMADWGYLPRRKPSSRRPSRGTRNASSRSETTDAAL